MRHEDTAARGPGRTRTGFHVSDRGDRLDGVRKRRAKIQTKTYLGPRVRAVVDEDQGGGNVDDQAEDGDEVGREPERHLADQPVPPWLQEAVEEAVARAAVLVLAEPLQLAGRQQPLLVELHAPSRIARVALTPCHRIAGTDSREPRERTGRAGDTRDPVADVPATRTRQRRGALSP